MLHGAAIMLRINKDWDWLFTLSSSDYPLVSQDELMVPGFISILLGVTQSTISNICVPVRVEHLKATNLAQKVDSCLAKILPKGINVMLMELGIQVLSLLL